MRSQMRATHGRELGPSPVTRGAPIQAHTGHTHTKHTQKPLVTGSHGTITNSYLCNLTRDVNKGIINPACNPVATHNPNEGDTAHTFMISQQSRLYEPHTSQRTNSVSGTSLGPRTPRCFAQPGHSAPCFACCPASLRRAAAAAQRAPVDPPDPLLVVLGLRERLAQLARLLVLGARVARAAIAMPEITRQIWRAGPGSCGAVGKCKGLFSRPNLHVRAIRIRSHTASDTEGLYDPDS